MEVEQKQTTEEENRCEFVNNQHSVDEEQINNKLDKTLLSDNQLHTNMKEGFKIRQGDTTMGINDIQVDNGCEDNNPCTSMSVDNSKEESDLSDYGEDNTTCQLANHALRAKLLSSVINPISRNDSKLRVSVFDHRIIPKKFISGGRVCDSHSVVDKVDNLNENVKSKQQSGVNVNEQNEQENGIKRKGSSSSNIPYTVLRANKRSNSEANSGSLSRNSSNMDSNSEFRTQFDVLLRSLIGDVNDMQVEPSPNTVSSGYESDYIQTRNAETDNTLNRNRKNSVQNKENIKHNENIPTGYFSISDTYPNTQVCPTTETQAFTSLPMLSSQTNDQENVNNNFESKEIPFVRTLKSDQTDSNGFSYAQRHNYKLTKVTRSMYEIIHDLQNGEKVGADGRRRSRKGRRSGPDSNSGSDGNVSAKESRPRGRLQSGNLIFDNNTDSLPCNRNADINTSSVSGSVVRCVRRPLCGDPSLRPVQRKFSHSESNNRLVTPCVSNNGDKVQNDLRNLLCGTSDVTLSSVGNNDQLGDFNTFPSGNTTHDRHTSTLKGHKDNIFNHSNSSINKAPDIADGQRRPTLTEQFHKRSKPDDHVYETIPGDEKLYEEWKKLRATSKMPRIRRFTTVPDLPGTFVPKEPPALPERRYLNNNPPPSNKDSDYIFMGDINSNFPAKDAITERSDSGYASVSSDKMLDSRAFQCYPYPLQDDIVLHQTGRSDETSDGYCSIDNLSLLREHITDTSLPEMAAAEWRIPNTNSIPRLPRKRNNFFSSQGDNKHNKQIFNKFNHMHPHSSTGRSHVGERSDRRAFQRSESETTLVPSSFEREAGKQVFQATYV